MVYGMSFGHSRFFLEEKNKGSIRLGVKGKRRFVILLHKNRRLRIKEQEESLVVENQGLKGKKN